MSKPNEQRPVIQWMHKKSEHFYSILDFGLRETTLEPTVIYKLADGIGPTWTRPCYEFFDGRFVQVIVVS